MPNHGGFPHSRNRDPRQTCNIFPMVGVWEACRFSLIFKWRKEKGYEGIIGMEHEMSKKGVEGETVLMDAYRRAYQF